VQMKTVPVLDAYSLKISGLDSTNWTPYEAEGVIVQAKVPVAKPYASLEVALANPT
jgi:hypothetical protein